MNRHTILKFSCLCFCICIWMFTGCKQFLNEVPDNRVSLDELDKAAKLLTNGYTSASYGFTDWMSDNVLYTRGTTLLPFHKQLYNWEDVTTDIGDQDNPDYYWSETYNAIAHANEVLAILPNLLTTDDKERRWKDAIEGEALLIRAYHHFMLANLFAEVYNPQTSGSSLGIPYIKEPETNFIATYKRGTLEDTYKAIEEDLLRGLSLVSDEFYNNSGKYHFTKNAALALACRFYMFKWNHAKCLEYANLLLGENPAYYIRNFNASTFSNSKSIPEEYAAEYTSPQLAANLLLMRKTSLIARPDFGFGPTESLYNALYSQYKIYTTGTDLRANPAYVKGQNAVLMVRYQNLFQRSSINSNVGNPYHIANVLTGEEVLYNRIEANIFLNNSEQAISDLQLIMNTRYENVSQGEKTLTLDGIKSFINKLYRLENEQITDQLYLFEFYLLEKRKEFLGMGLRWFDIRRFGLPVFHDDASGNTLTLQRNDLRKIIQIPTSAIEVSGLEPNPR